MRHLRQRQTSLPCLRHASVPNSSVPQLPPPAGVLRVRIGATDPRNAIRNLARVCHAVSSGLTTNRTLAPTRVTCAKCRTIRLLPIRPAVRCQQRSAGVRRRFFTVTPRARSSSLSRRLTTIDNDRRRGTVTTPRTPIAIALQGPGARG